MSASDDEEQDFTEFHQASNRKGRKAGGWQVIGLDHPVFKGIEKKGYKQPTPIQRKTIPCILDGKDVVAMSRTGSGKTAAFVIPMLQRLKGRDTKGIRALLVSPTRELALQTFKVVKELGKFTGLRCAVLVGGDNLEDQFGTIHENPDILIATPGRLLHLVVEMNLRMTHMEYVVFDEADRLFEMGFEQQLIETLKRIPESRQTLLFSATLPKMLVDFAKAGLSDPMLVRLDVDEKISDNLSMIFVTCRADEKLNALVHLCREADNSGKQTVVFCATMKHVEYVVSILQRGGIEVSFVYSQLDSVARKQNILKFREKQTKILVVTDVAARGVDIPLLDTVINLHFPPKAKLFVHRVGRVARAGRSGTAITLVAPDEVPYLCDLFLFLGKPMRFATDADKYDENTTLIGRLPETIVTLESDFLTSIHDNNEEMKDLRHKATNAMKKFSVTRPPPSAESARRTKDELRTKSFESSIHPYLRLEGDQQSYEILNALASYKSRATIFEIHGTDKKDAGKIMKEKRKEHEAHIVETKELKRKEKANMLEAVELKDGEEADEDMLASTFTQVIGAGGGSGGEEMKKKKRDREAEIRREKEEFYIPYTAADFQSEKQLAIEKVDFARQADHAAVDICADDESGMSKQQSQRRWDRKLKRFVGAANDDPAKKKIRTEDGTWLPASYKSGRYALWQKKQKMGYQRDENDSDEGDGGRNENADMVSRRGRGRGGMRGGRGGAGGGDRGEGGKEPRNELKNKDQMLKERKKKDKVQSYQKERRDENLKRAERRGGGRGGGGMRGGRGGGSRGGGGMKGGRDGGGFKGGRDGGGMRGGRGGGMRGGRGGGMRGGGGGRGGRDRR